MLWLAVRLVNDGVIEFTVRVVEALLAAPKFVVAE